MNSFENRTYVIAIIIVVLGTLIVTAGFTIGLLFLTRSDDSVIVEERSIIDIKEAEIPDLTSDIQIELDDDIIKEGIVIERIPIKIIRLDRMSIEEYLVSLDLFMRNYSNGRRQASWDTSKHNSENNMWVFIDKSDFSLTLYSRNKVIRKWRIAVGIVPGDKQRVGDNKTPNGIFRINQIQNSSEWTYDFGDGRGQVRGAYGPWFIRLHTPPWSGIGIHGTHDPDSIGSRASEGCVRMNNKDITELKNMVRVGMPVIIVE